MSAILPDVIGAIADLNPAERLAMGTVRHLVNRGLGANRILSELRRLGMGKRRTRGLLMVRIAKSQNISRSYVNSVNLSKQLDFNRLEPSLKPLRKPLMYTVRLQGTHPVTGERVIKDVTIWSDSLLTKEESSQFALEHMFAGDWSYEMEGVTAMTTGVNRSLDVVVDRQVGQKLLFHRL